MKYSILANATLLQLKKHVPFYKKKNQQQQRPKTPYTNRYAKKIILTFGWIVRLENVQSY